MRAHVFSKYLMISRIFAFFTLALMVIFTLPLYVDANTSIIDQITTDTVDYTGDLDWSTTLDYKNSTNTYISYTTLRSTYCPTGTTAAQCISNVSGKVIRFDTAEELYRFSVDVSYEYIYQTETVKLSQDVIAALLSFNYVLGNDIDYSVMGAKTFIPIGYNFTTTQGTNYQNYFTGTFDGQGYMVKNLYVAGYDYLVYEDYIDANNTVDIALSPYYSMFPFNNGTIANFGLYNPTFELLNLHIDINKVSNIVGLNLPNGVVDHVFVIDDRTDVLEAGIRYKVGTTSGSFQAAGLIHTNQGTFTNSYFVGKVVVNGNYINKFTIQPVLYQNSGTIGHLVYDSDVYLLNVTVGTSTFTVATPNGLATGEDTTTMKSESSSLNYTGSQWYFYPSDGYPSVQGLDYDAVEEAYIINEPNDLTFFSKLLAYNTVLHGKTFASSDYMLTNDIDMSWVSSTAYKTPSVTFTGTFSGYNASGTDLSDNYYIYNFNLTKGVVRATGYYVGLFSIIGVNGEVSNLNISQSSYTLTNTESYYSSVFYVGGLTGKVSGGTVSNVIVDIDINLGTAAIGKSYLGGIAGQAIGTIEHVANFGDLYLGNHTYQSTYNVNPVFYAGGIVGAADSTTMVIDGAENYGDIYDFGTNSSFNFVSGVTRIDIKIGGIIGYIVNTDSVVHQLKYVSNYGNLYEVNYKSKTTMERIGGVFGELYGYAPVLEESEGFHFAYLYNEGNINASYMSTSITVQTAGIGVSNTTEAVEYGLLFNHGTFSYNESGDSYSSPMFRYTGTILDVSSYEVTLTRVYNYGDQTYASNYYTSISPLYLSLNNNTTLIRYSANFGDIYYWNSSGSSTITTNTNLVVTGITASANVNLQNVENAGNITVVNLNLGSYTLEVSGITNSLASGKLIKNSINQGDIIVAEITGTGNIYVGGIVVSNYSGDLQSSSQSETQPIATIGIMNTINYGSIKSTYNSSYYGINGTSNTFVGGVAALNDGSIQDAANMGDIEFYNSSTSGSTSFRTESYYAGLVSSYTTGVILGGVVGVTLSGDARVYDTANNGNITAVTYQYSRAGGVLGISLYEEGTSGGITAAMGLTDDIEDSILSNGLNFGNVTAITSVVPTYSTSSYTLSSYWYYGSGSTSDEAYYYEQTTYGTQERPEINASAGGVIGYGLSVMKRMLNHGTISSTDVAGGIVGATYVLGSNYGNVTTVTHIRTAINYGDIKAINPSSYSSINKVDLSYSNYSSYFLADGNTYIYPSGYSRFEPGAKRGFGGIFGRLQRGTNGIMTSEGGEFDFIVNANPNIDLIGRLDQVLNFSSSGRYFRFNNAIYYSAKYDDTTQVVFTGFYYVRATVDYKTGYNPYTYGATATTLYKQVGIVSTNMGSMSTYFYFYSKSSLYTYSSNRYDNNYYVVYEPVEVPWITEDPTDSRITNSSEEYMYDVNFPMRTDPDLTEYIYYMEADLLADRFQTTGTNPRPNGMYVLSTSAGSTYGSVLPANINVSTIGLVDEDYLPAISLVAVNYDEIPLQYHRTLDTEVLTKYQNLRQTKYNDKSELIPSDTISMTLEEVGGSDTTLSNATIDYNNHTVTFEISMEAFESTQTTASYEITEALSSLYSLIAARPSDIGYGSNLAAYQPLLYLQKDDGIATGSIAAVLDVTLPSYNITSDVTLSLGYFSVFSEAFVNSDVFANSSYYTDYQIYITFTPTIANGGSSIDITEVTFNGTSTVTYTSSPSDITGDGDVNNNGSLYLKFESDKANSPGVLQEDYDFKDNFNIYYNDGGTYILIPSTYYTIDSVPVVISTYSVYWTTHYVSTYEITFTFSDELRSGDYKIEYSYFPSSTVYTLLFDKAASSESSLNDFTYYSENGSVYIDQSADTITSYVNMGTTIDMDTSTTNFTSYTDPNIPVYLTNTTYNIDFMTSGSLEISAFASIIAAQLTSMTYDSNGYKVYVMSYTVQAEDGTQTVYTHTMYERTVDVQGVLENGNEVDLGDLSALREDASTVFKVDLGFDSNLNLYSVTNTGSNNYIVVDVTGTTLDGLTTYLPAEIVGLTYSVGDGTSLVITMDNTTLPGDYVFTIYVYRDGSTTEYITIATQLTITKLAGVDSYLTDIRFSNLANETEYPDIYITDSNGVINTTTGLDVRVYYNGIDYDGANELDYRYYRVDGKVSNTPLNEYMPYMVDYLPTGASIARYAYDSNTSSWYWTSEVTADSTLAEQSVLATDFTLMPETGQEPGENEEVVILYRVTSEDGLNYTYYFTTVTDVTYNVTLIFDIYYCADGTANSCVLASQSTAFENELVIINVKNLDTNGDDSVYGVQNPADYPTFSVVNSINNQMTEFYFTYDGDYRYSFGRNMAGFYTFDVELPLDQYLNDMYTYDIEFLEYTLNDASNYVSYLDGKYFYIEYATKNRSRRFNVYIYPISTPSTDAPWGLYDFFRSWSNNN